MSYTYAKLTTIANELPGRSQASETNGHRCVSTIRNAVQQLEKAGLIWGDELGIHVSALEPRPEQVQATLVDEPTPTLNEIADQIQAAVHDGNFAEVARLAETAKAIKANGQDSKSHAAAEVGAKNCAAESKNCAPPLIKDLNASNGGGSKQSTEKKLITTNDVPDTPTVKVLRDVGTIAPEVLTELADRPVDEAKNAVHIAMTRPSVREPAAYAVWALRAKLGAQQVPRMTHRRSVHQPYDSPEAINKYINGDLAGLIKH